MTDMLHSVFRWTAIRSNDWHRLSFADYAMLLSLSVLATLAGVTVLVG